MTCNIYMGMPEADICDHLYPPAMADKYRDGRYYISDVLSLQNRLYIDGFAWWISLRLKGRWWFKSLIDATHWRSERRHATSLMLLGEPLCCRSRACDEAWRCEVYSGEMATGGVICRGTIAEIVRPWRRLPPAISTGPVLRRRAHDSCSCSLKSGWDAAGPHTAGLPR